MAVRKVGFLLFEGFELLDVFGPAEIFGVLDRHFSVELVARSAGHVTSAQGPVVVAQLPLEGAMGFDLLIVPGGKGTREVVDEPEFLEALCRTCESIELVGSVCTGSGVLARAGLLDDRRATSNKLAFEWASEQGPKVDWQRQARWVDDGKYWTSSGVTAGMDMALAIVARLHDDALARRLAAAIEYDWHEDSGWDPFAALYEWTRD